MMGCSRVPKVVAIGDAHGAFHRLRDIRKKHSDADEILIVGDFGWFGNGLRSVEEAWLKKFGETEVTSKPYIRVLAGNHDNIDALRRDFPLGGISFIDHGTIEGTTLYVGGAWSIDGVTGVWPNSRIPGIDWWDNEELSREEWEQIFAAGKGKRIETVISHDFPAAVFPMILPGARYISTRTSEYLEELRQMLPDVKLWIGGHYHVSRDFEFEGTRFRVLDCDGKDHITFIR